MLCFSVLLKFINLPLDLAKSKKALEHQQKIKKKKKSDVVNFKQFQCEFKVLLLKKKKKKTKGLPN